MSDGGDDLAKAIINRTRSSFGTGLEDLAYMISDFSPGYEPAKTVLKNNTAGSISAKADSQFLKAKEKTGDFGDKLIDVADSSAETLGYSMFGPKAFYAMGTAEGFAEYKKLRMEGYSPEESLFGATKKAGFAIASEKVDDFVGKNSPIDEVLKGTNRSVDNFAHDAYNRANKPGEIKNNYYNLLTRQEWAKYYKAIAEQGRLNRPIGSRFVWGEGKVLIYTEKVNLTGTTSDYQVKKFEIIMGGNADEIAYYLQKEIDKDGG